MVLRDIGFLLSFNYYKCSELSLCAGTVFLLRYVSSWRRKLGIPRISLKSQLYNFYEYVST